MTVSPAGPGSEVAEFDPSEFGDVGLEDIGAGDVVIPRISINHTEGRFKNNLTGEEYDTLNVVLLGMVKQRIFWSDDVEDGEQPLCKSPDFKTGFPQMKDSLPADKKFPWDDSNFALADYSANLINGHVALPCEKCVFSQWGKDKNGKSTPPPCNEQHTYPLLYVDEDNNYVPALFTVQKTGIKPSRSYVSGFASSRTPLFTVHTTLGLQLQSRGSVKYSVPVFKRSDATDRSFWQDWATQARQIREFIRQPPRNTEDIADSEPDPEANVNTAPAAQTVQAQPAQPAAPAAQASPPPAPAKPAPAQPAAPAAPAAEADDDDDIPF